MRTGISFGLTASDRNRLLAISNDRNSQRKHVWRAKIVLLSAEGIGEGGAIGPPAAIANAVNDALAPLVA